MAPLNDGPQCIMLEHDQAYQGWGRARCIDPSLVAAARSNPAVAACPAFLLAKLFSGAGGVGMARSVRSRAEIFRAPTPSPAGAS